MLNWDKAQHKGSRLLKELDKDDLYDQLDTVLSYLKEVTGTFNKAASRNWGRTRDQVADTAHQTEEMMKDNLAASLILAVGLGVFVGYMIRRGSD